jgi:AcrR family transcriptional regulator
VKQEKLDAILETARKVFSRYGPKRTNIDEIARIARVAKGTIYNHFGSKDAVYLEVLAREVTEIIENISSAVESETSPEKKLTSFARAKFLYMRHAVNLLNLDREAVEERPRRAEKTRERLFESEVRIVTSILKEGAEKGVFTINDLLLTARAICHSLRGFELSWMVRESEERIEQYLDELFGVLLFGILSEKNRRPAQGPAMAPGE